MHHAIFFLNSIKLTIIKCWFKVALFFGTSSKLPAPVFNRYRSSYKVRDSLYTVKYLKKYSIFCTK